MTCLTNASTCVLHVPELMQKVRISSVTPHMPILHVEMEFQVELLRWDFTMRTVA